MKPNVENFIGCDSDYAAAKIVLYGAPFDSTTSFRPRGALWPGGDAARKLWAGNLQPLPGC